MSLALELALASAAGAVAGGGVLLLVLALTGNLPRRDPGRPSRWAALRRNPRRSTVQVLVGLGVGVVTLVVTGWIVLAVALGLLAGMWQQVFGGAAAERLAIARLEALASWTESLRDTIAGAVGLEQAIPVTAQNAAPVIRPALNLLVDRLRIRTPLPTALLRFSDDLDDPSADLVVAALVLNARLRGPGLRDVLGALAASAREELDLRRRIDAARRSTRRSVQIVVAITLGVAGLLILLNRSYVEPYGTAAGQLVLVAVIALFSGGILWLRRLARVEVPDRFVGGSFTGAAGVREPVAGGAR